MEHDTVQWVSEDIISYFYLLWVSYGIDNILYQSCILMKLIGRKDKCSFLSHFLAEWYSLYIKEIDDYMHINDKIIGDNYCS